MKICKGSNGCGQLLPNASFNKNKASKDGLSHVCRVCDNAYNRKNYSNRDSFLMPEADDIPGQMRTIDLIEQRNRIQAELAVLDDRQDEHEAIMELYS